jgi:hypothetical protein
MHAPFDIGKIKKRELFFLKYEKPHGKSMEKVECRPDYQ